LLVELRPEPGIVGLLLESGVVGQLHLHPHRG